MPVGAQDGAGRARARDGEGTWIQAMKTVQPDSWIQLCISPGSSPAPRSPAHSWEFLSSFVMSLMFSPPGLLWLVDDRCVQPVCGASLVASQMLVTLVHSFVCVTNAGPAPLLSLSRVLLAGRLRMFISLLNLVPSWS